MLPEFSGDFIQWLRGFYYTAQTGSMTAAAELMHRNQSAITHQIKSLEEELNVKLFTGKKGNRSLTAEGQFLFAKALLLFDSLNEMKKNIGEINEELGGEISIACFYTAMEYYLPDRVAAFQARYPQVRFRLSGAALREPLLNRLYSREYDIAFMVMDSGMGEFLSEPVLASEMVLVSPLDGPLAIPALPDLERLSRLPFISHPDNSSLEPFIQRQFTRHGLALHSAHMVSHCGALKEYIARGLGVSILDSFVCTPFDRQRMNVVSLSPYFPGRSFGVVRRRDAYLPAQTEAFVHFLLEGRQEPSSPDQYTPPEKCPKTNR